MNNKQQKTFANNLKYRYGITPEIYYEILKRQGNKCAICGKKQRDEKRRFAVDHNHQTGFIRGLLCNYCNSKLMMFLRDSKSKALGLVCYLNSALMNDEAWE